MSDRLRWNIIKQFARRNTFGFTFQDVVREFPGRNRIFLSRILADMVDKGMLCKVDRNKYLIIPLNMDPKTYVPDRHRVAKYIMHNKEYYIGYASALKIYGLALQCDNWKSGVWKSDTEKTEVNVTETEASKTEASEDRVYVVTKVQMRPANLRFGDITYQFIHRDETLFFGFESIWVNQLEKAMVSDLERTIVDIAAKPQYSGGIVKVGMAILQSQERSEHDKLFYYFARNRNKSAKKRFLFLTDLLGLEWTTDHERMRDELGSGISLLDPLEPDNGSRMMRFGLRINVDPDRIKNRVLQ